MELNMHDILASMNKSGYRVTKQRQVIVEEVADSPCLQSAEEVYKRCKTVDNCISFPTIYRTLEVLVTLGFVRKLNINGRACFEFLRPGQKHHHHMLCQHCGTMLPFDTCPDKLIRELAASHDFTVVDHHFEIIGVCKNCAPMNGGKVNESSSLS
jgi:Fur family ferric uptake transcriptional regulator